MRRFHEHQQNAYDNSARLLVLLAAAILGTVLLSGAVVTYLVAVGCYSFAGTGPSENVVALATTFAVTSFVCSLVIASGTLIKLHQLRAGGKVIAKDMGGRLVEEPDDQQERRLTNVVEEISISSGVPVPAIYILDGNDSINAFAAGYEPRNAVIAVTRGAIRHLKRDELQGVIAHEFSHILNGDMRLNLKMVGWLYGVLSVAIVADTMIDAGKKLLENSFHHDGRCLASGVLLLVLGCALWPVGLIGTFMSLLVRSATNRQREFLADAFAVQFTRNPEGLGNAFKRLSGHAAGGRIRSPNCIEASHLFLVEGCGKLASLLASHPPLGMRILRLDPDWDGLPLFTDSGELGDYQGAFQGAMGLVSHLQPATPAAIQPGEWLDNRVREVPDMLATVEFAESVLRSLPEPLLKITETPGGDSLVLYGLWLAHAHDESAGYALLDEPEVQRVTPLVPFLRRMEPPQQVLLLDTALEGLHTSGGQGRGKLRKVCQRFIDLCEKDNLFHWMWNVALSAALGFGDEPSPRYGQLKQVEGACEVVLSKVCYAGGSMAVAGFSFQRGLANLGLENVGLLPEEECSWDKFQLAMDLVSQLAPAPRRQVLLACSSALTSDRDVSPDEAYIVRGVCQRLGYDVPSLLPGQPVTPGT